MTALRRSLWRHVVELLFDVAGRPANPFPEDSGRDTAARVLLLCLFDDRKAQLESVVGVVAAVIVRVAAGNSHDAAAAAPDIDTAIGTMWTALSDGYGALADVYSQLPIRVSERFRIDGATLYTTVALTRCALAAHVGRARTPATAADAAASVETVVSQVASVLYTALRTYPTFQRHRRAHPDGRTVPSQSKEAARIDGLLASRRAARPLSALTFANTAPYTSHDRYKTLLTGELLRLWARELHADIVLPLFAASRKVTAASLTAWADSLGGAEVEDRVAGWLADVRTLTELHRESAYCCALVKPLRGQQAKCSRATAFNFENTFYNRCNDCKVIRNVKQKVSGVSVDSSGLRKLCKSCGGENNTLIEFFYRCGSGVGYTTVVLATPLALHRQPSTGGRLNHSRVAPHYLTMCVGGSRACTNIVPLYTLNYGAAIRCGQCNESADAADESICSNNYGRREQCTGCAIYRTYGRRGGMGITAAAVVE